MKRVLLVLCIFFNLNLNITHAQSNALQANWAAAENLGVYNCVAIQTYNQQNPPIMITSSNMPYQLCASSPEQANNMSTESYYRGLSNSGWQITGQCTLGSPVPFSACTYPGQPL